MALQAFERPRQLAESFFFSIGSATEGARNGDLGPLRGKPCFHSFNVQGRQLQVCLQASHPPPLQPSRGPL
jgi:hypothetical protein